MHALAVLPVGIRYRLRDRRVPALDLLGCGRGCGSGAAHEFRQRAREAAEIFLAVVGWHAPCQDAADADHARGVRADQERLGPAGIFVELGDDAVEAVCDSVVDAGDALAVD